MAARDGHAPHTLVVLHSASAAGPPRHVAAWLEPLARRGRLTTVVPQAGGASELYGRMGATAVAPYEPLTFPRGPRALAPFAARHAAGARALAGLVRRLRPDLVVAVTSSVPGALLAARLHGVPAIVFVGELLDKGMDDGRGRRLASAATVRLTAALADAVVCCSDAVARQFEPLRPRMLRTIHPGVDGSYGGGDGAGFRARHGLVGAAPCIAVAGNITPARGQDVAIRALAALRGELPAARLVIAGEPHARASDRAYRRELGELARRLGVGDAVAFAGLVDPVADLYAAADIVVNPARFNEPFGRVAIEALSAGCAVVAARVGAIPEVVRDGREALLFEAGDHDGLRGALAQLWGDPQLRRSLVASGCERVATAFDERRAVAEFGAVVDRVLATRAAPASAAPAPSGATA